MKHLSLYLLGLVMIHLAMAQDSLMLAANQKFATGKFDEAIDLYRSEGEILLKNK